MLDLLNCGDRLLSPCIRDPHVFVGKVEVLGVGVTDQRPIARLSGEPLEESLEPGKR